MRAISPCPFPSRSRTSNTIFTARSRSSSGYFRCAGMTLPGSFTGVAGCLLGHVSGFLIKISVLRAGLESGCRAGTPDSTVRLGSFLVVGSAVPGSDRGGQCPHRVPGAGEVGGPGPVGAEVEPAFPLAAGEAGGDMQEPEPQQLRGSVP